MKFISQARQQQSLYRQYLGEPVGKGPWRSSPNSVISMLQNGEQSGKNFILKETFDYAKERVRHKKREEI
jgi:hypothetical protein